MTTPDSDVYRDNLRAWAAIKRNETAEKAAKRRDTEGEDYWIGQAEAFQEVIDWADRNDG